LESINTYLYPPRWHEALCIIILLAVCSGNLKAANNNVLRLTSFEVTRSNSDNFDSNTAPEPVTLPDSWHERQKTPFRNAWYRTQFRADDIQSPIAVYIPRVSMNASVTVNGKEIGNGGRFTEPISRNHGRSLFYIVPSWITQQSDIINLTIRVTDNSWAFGYLGPVYVGDAATLNSMYHTREFWQVHLTLALALLMLIFSIASLSLYVKRAKEKYYFWFSGAMLLFAVDTFNVFVIDIPTSRQTWEIYNQIVVYAFAVMTITFVHRFTHVGWKAIEPLLGAVLIIKLFVLIMLDVEYLFVAASAFNLLVIGYGLILAFLVIRSYLIKPRFETGVTALSGLILLAVASHTWLVQLGILNPENLHIIHYGAPCFFLLISLSLVRKFLYSLENTEALASELDLRVQQKEIELASSYEELQILNQKKTLSEERTRIMREVHDGFGAHVVGALAMLETEKVNHRALSDYLRSSLLDLRIMIDSLDPNTHEVSVALGMLRTRVEPILKNKNIILDWDVHNLPDDLLLNPNKTLSLLRVLQELITNVIKHSVASRIKIRASIERCAQEDILLIKFWENGNGFDPDSQTGRGIRNIRKRINDLGGKIIHKKEVGGYNISITVPNTPLTQ